MRTVKIAVGIDHLGFDPQSKIHPEPIYVIDQWLQTVGEFLRIYEPIAETGMVVIALAEPAVVHNKQLDAELGSFVRKLLLTGLVDGELRGLPGIIKHRPRAGL